MQRLLCANIDKACYEQELVRRMPIKPMNVSLTSELRAAVERRVRSGRYGNASDVVRAGLRALEREELGAAWTEWQEAKANLPKEQITSEIEQKIEVRIRASRTVKRRTIRP